MQRCSTASAAVHARQSAPNFQRIFEFQNSTATAVFCLLQFPAFSHSAFHYQYLRNSAVRYSSAAVLYWLRGEANQINAAGGAKQRSGCSALVLCLRAKPWTNSPRHSRRPPARVLPGRAAARSDRPRAPACAHHCRQARIAASQIDQCRRRWRQQWHTRRVSHRSRSSAGCERHGRPRATAVCDAGTRSAATGNLICSPRRRSRRSGQRRSQRRRLGARTVVWFACVVAALGFHPARVAVAVCRCVCAPSIAACHCYQR